jgi:hypothetical protein
MALDLRPSSRLHGIWPHTIKYQDIKLLGLMDHDTRHPSISVLQQPFVPANHSGNSKKKSKQFMRPQKVKEEQYLSEPPIWIQSMMEWMMQSCRQPPTGRQAWVKKDDVQISILASARVICSIVHEEVRDRIHREVCVSKEKSISI